MNDEKVSSYVDEERDFAFEFEAKILKVASISWTKDKDKNGQPYSEPKPFHINKYSFTSEFISGTLVEWLDKPTAPLIRHGNCKIRFNQLRPSREMFGFYELSGYPVS